MLADRFGTRRIFTLAVSLFTWVLWPAHFPTRYHSWLSSGLSGDRRRNDDACCSAGLTARFPRNELLPVLNFVAMPGLVGQF